MKLTEKIIEAIITSEEYKRNFTTIPYNGNFTFNKIDYASVYFRKNGADVVIGIECQYTLNGVSNVRVISFQFKIGIATPKGYFSSKKIQCQIVDEENLTEDELTLLMNYFNADTRENTFDPFFAENNAKRKNAAGWAYVASKLQPDCRG